MSDIVLYPFSTPIVLTDVLFDQYGGNFANSNEFQRQAAYVLAEELISDDIDTLLLNSRVTGTYVYNRSYSQNFRITLGYGYVTNVVQTKFIDFEGNTYYTITGTDNIFVGLRDPERGIIDLSHAVKNCGCHSASRLSPYKIQVVYECGLPSGTAYSPKVLLATTTVANIMLNEIIGWGNEGVGDVGVQEFRNQEYSEKRTKLKNTVYGNSARANFAWKILKKLRKRRRVSL